jgi:hypothetical protein
MSAAIRQVRVQRLLLSGVALEPHDLTRLPGLIAGALRRPASPDVGSVDPAEVHALAGSIAARITDATSSRPA